MVTAGAAPNYSVVFDGLAVRGPGKGRLDGIAMAPGTFADDVAITNSDFAEMGVVVARNRRAGSQGLVSDGTADDHR